VGYVINRDLNIVGDGSPYVTILGQPALTLFEVEAGYNVSISGVSIESAGDSGIKNLGTLQLDDVRVSSNDSDGAGGGINNSGELTISNSLIINNETISSGGHGGGIRNTGTLTLLDSEVTLNSTPGSGSLGGGIYSSGTLVIERTVIHTNVADFRGGGIYSSGTLELTDVGIFNNHATDSSTSFGGGLWNTGLATLRSVTINGNSAQSAGGGIWNENTKAYLINSTVSGNNAPHGGGIAHQGPAVGELFSIYSSTIANNLTGAGSSAGAGGLHSYGPITLTNSIVVGNEGDNCVEDLVYTISSTGYSLEDTDTCGFTAVGDQVNTDPQLLSLAYNGGFTQTHALPAGSPAIDAGNPSGCTDEGGAPILTDQRGWSRSLDGDLDGTPVCDIGAYEFEPLEIFLPLIVH
jgi:hypothetical protein